MPRKKRNPCRNPEQDTPTPDQNGPETSGTVANRRIDDPPSPGQSPRRRRRRTLTPHERMPRKKRNPCRNPEQDTPTPDQNGPETSGTVANRRIDDPPSPGQSPRRRRPRTLAPHERMPRKKRNPCRNPEQDTPTPDQNGPETSGTVANRRIDDPPSPGQSPRRRRPRTLAPQTSGAVAKRRIDDPTSPGQSPRRRRPRTLTPRPITQDLPFTWRRVPPLPYNQTASSSSSGDWLPLGADAGNFNTELSPRFRRPMEAETTYDVSVITSSRASDDEVVCLEERVEQPETQGANPRNSHFSVGDDEFENQMSFSEYFGTATTNNVSRDDDGVICLEDMVEQPETQGTNPQTSHFSVEDDEFENQMSFSDYFGTATTNNVNRDDDGVICWEDMVVQRETQGTNPRRSLFLVGDDEFENQMNFSDFFGTATTINKDENNVVDLDKMERSEEPTTPRKETTNHRPRLYSLPPELESTTDMHIRWDDLMNNTSPLSAARLGLLPPPLPSDMKNKNSMKTFNVHGNNTLQQEPVYETMDQFVASFVSDKSKRRPIYKILVATNGIASVRCILAIRKLLMKTFRNDRMIQFICLTTEHEVQSNAEYLKLADYIVFSPSGSNKNNYANVDEIVRHAIEQNVDAVWAGWGHASENPELPKKLAEHNISFIGPPSEAMSSLGDKIASTLIAQTVGIPTIEWSGSGIKMESEKRAPGRIVEVPQELIDLATVANVKEGLKALKKHKIGFPLMIKASAGGGGKGIRKCTRKEDFKDMFEQVCQEVENSPIFLMKCVENARHIEVQLIADRYETVIPVFTRDCSIQRRCQKIIEEAPASIADEEILKQMQEDAVRLAKFVGYESAGTVEYMYLPDEKKYYFLELNPRLQVEHPCTEMISNMSIPAIQLQIAMGLPLHRIEDIRLFFGLDRYGDSPLPAETVLTKTAYCVIAARITSENPDDSFRPSIGAVEVLNFRSSQDVWGYFSVSSGGKVHEYADSQFGHLFARGRTRMEAVSSLLAALKELELRATFHSQVQYLVDLLLEPDFTHNRFNTQWLDIRIAQKIKQKPTFPMNEVVAVSAAVIGHTRVTTVFENFRAAIDRGQVLPPNDLTETFLFDLVQDLQIYSMTVVRCAPLSYVVTMNGLSTRVNMIVLGNGNLMVTHGESVHQCSLVETSELFKVTIGKTINVFEKDNDPSVLKSPYTGKLLSYKRETGDEVRVGDVYATVESMKLVFNTEVTKAPGRFLQVANEGDLLFPGSIIARLTDQMDVELYKPKKYQKAFEEWNTDNEEMDVADHKAFKKLIQKCDDVMNGSAPLGGELVVAQYVKDLFNNFLAKSELPKIVYLPAITSLISKLEEKHQKWLFVEIHSPDFNLTKIITYIRENCQKADDEVRELADRMEYECKHGYACHVIESIFQKYIAVEKYFEDKIYDESVTEIKKDVSDSGKVVEVIYSHMMREYKNVVLFTLMEMLATKAVFWIPHLTESLRALGNLHNAKGISRKARELLMLTLTHKYHQNFEELKLEVSPFSPNVSDILKWLECPAPSSQLWNNIHEYFFDPVYGEKIVDAYVNNFLQAIERENYQVLENNFTAQVKIADISPPTDLHQVQLPKKTLTVVRLLFPNLASLNVREIERLFKEHLADEEYRRSTYTVLYMKIEGVEEPLDTKFEVIPSLTRNELQIVEQFKKVSAELVDKYGPEFRCSLCLPRRPLIGCDFVDALRLKLDELPEGAKLVSSPISSVHTYQLNDNDNQFASLRTYQVLSFRKRGTARMMKDLSSETIFNAIDAAATAAKVVMASSDKKFTENYGQVFLVLPNCDEKEGEEVGRIIKEELEKYMDVLVKHNFSKFEIIFTTKISSTLSDPTRKYVQFENYGGALTLVNVVSKSYWKMEPLTVRNKKQYSTRLNDTIYVYDVPMLIANCIDNRWDRVAKKDIGFYRTIKALLPDSVQVAMKHKDWESIIKFHEIALEDQQLKFYDSVDFSHRKNIAPNRCGIVGYVVEVQLPEYFGRRKFVVIANDITYQSGSFGTDEDDLFAALSNYAQDENLPIVNISCNSGARIGLASTVMKYLKVQLREGSETFDYIYIDEEDMKHVEDQVVVTRLPNGHCAIDAVIGAKNERIGVENLMGSGLIAGCTAEAYSKVPTYCFVTGRSVGIGAYTARLAHRIVQHKSSNLILTGSAALNTLLGKKVYSSNNQLGGIDIMHRNGVAHAVAENNSAGIDKILDWLSYLPQQEDRTGPLTSIVPPPVPNTGDVDPRSVSKPPSSGMKDFDVRQLIDSTELGIDTGICDSGSFDEISSEWAKSIITGRARLCDIPIGVIATELRNFNTLTPADPAVEGSEAQNTIRAGQVWYPDSAYKTAEAINDFAVEKIPLLFIASLRGFSSGQKDMYDMVLKFGAEIVSALRAYKRPVIVYIPAFGELRGGAWAVLDKNINPEFITMVADDTSRGGILEPNAIVSIKFREDKQRKLMQNSDAAFKQLSDRLKKETDSVKRLELSEMLKEREETLRKSYRAAAVEFADAHDRHDRMQSVGAVQHTVELHQTRHLFHNIIKCELIRVRMAEELLVVPSLKPLSLSEAMKIVRTEVEQYAETAYFNIEDLYGTLIQFFDAKWQTVRQNYLQKCSEEVERQFALLRNSFCTFQQSSSPIRDEEKPRINLPNTML